MKFYVSHNKTLITLTRSAFENKSNVIVLDFSADICLCSQRNASGIRRLS